MRLRMGGSGWSRKINGPPRSQTGDDRPVGSSRWHWSCVSDVATLSGAAMSQGVPHCTFCDLIRGAAEVSICHEDAESIAFMDIQPVNVGHVLVVPREHYESLLDVPPEIGVHLFRVTMQLAGAVRRVTNCEDMNIVVN